MTVEHTHGLKELITGQFLQTEIRAANISDLETANRNQTAVLNAVNLANVADLNAINLSGVNVVKNITDATVLTNKAIGDTTTSVIKNITDGTILVNKSISEVAAQTALNSAENRLAVAVASGEMRLATEISDNLTRGNIATGATADAIAAKDIQLAVYKDGSHTREEAAEAIAELALQTSRETAALALQAAKDTAAILLEVSKICCCTKDAVTADGERTRGLIAADNTRRLESELAEARLKAAIADLRRGDK